MVPAVTVQRMELTDEPRLENPNSHGVRADFAPATGYSAESPLRPQLFLFSRALVASRQIDELEQLLEEGYFPPEGAELDDLAPRVPPKGVEVILRLTIPRERFEDIMGSVAEQYARDCERFGEAQARWIAYVDAVKSVGPLVWLAVMWLFKGAP